MMILALVLPALLSAASGSLDFYMDAAQTERLYGVSTAKGIYYIKDGIVNQYAMTFQDQVGNHYRVTHQKPLIDLDFGCFAILPGQ